MQTRMIPLRLVVDTNILVSAAISQTDFNGPANAPRADYLVTGNLRHFSKFWKKAKVITSRELIDIVATHLIR